MIDGYYTENFRKLVENRKTRKKYTERRKEMAGYPKYYNAGLYRRLGKKQQEKDVREMETLKLILETSCDPANGLNLKVIEALNNAICIIEDQTNYIESREKEFEEVLADRNRYHSSWLELNRAFHMCQDCPQRDNDDDEDDDIWPDEEDDDEEDDPVDPDNASE